MDSRVQEAWDHTRIRIWPDSYILAAFPRSRAADVAAVVASEKVGFAALVLEGEEVSLTVKERRWEGMALASTCHASAGPYRAITLEAELELDLCGYLAPAAARLAEAGVPIVPQCGHRTDHLLVREEDLAAALRVLEELAGRGSLEG